MAESNGENHVLSLSGWLAESGLEWLQLCVQLAAGSRRNQSLWQSYIQSWRE